MKPLFLLFLAALIMPETGLAVTCEVPNQRPNIQTAIDDVTCTDIVLTAQTYPESVVINRDLLMFGPPGGGAIIRGEVAVQGSSVLAMLADFTIENGCVGMGLDVSQSAQVQTIGLSVQLSSQFPCLPPDAFFFGGFE